MTTKQEAARMGEKLEQVRRWRPDGEPMYECDANGKFVNRKIKGRSARPIRFFDSVGSNLVDGADFDALSSRCAELEKALRGPDPEAPESIQPLSWLRSAIAELKQRGPRDNDADPDSYWEMVTELESFAADIRAALGGQS